MVVETEKNKGGREEEGLKRKEKRKGGRLKSKGRARGNEKNPTSRFGLV